MLQPLFQRKLQPPCGGVSFGAKGPRLALGAQPGGLEVPCLHQQKPVGHPVIGRSLKGVIADEVPLRAQFKRRTDLGVLETEHIGCKCRSKPIVGEQIVVLLGRIDLSIAVLVQRGLARRDPAIPEEESKFGPRVVLPIEEVNLRSIRNRMGNPQPRQDPLERLHLTPGRIFDKPGIRLGHRCGLSNV